MYLPLLKLIDWLLRGLSPFIAQNKRLGWHFDERLVTSQDWAGEIKSCPQKVWIQAASLGEAQLASQLVFELANEATAESHNKADSQSLSEAPETNSEKQAVSQKTIGLLLTSGTPEGRAELLKTKDSLKNCVVRLFPLFSQTYMRRALLAAKPDLVVLLETELWPGLMQACAEARIPLVVLNARMSERSFKRYKLIKGLWSEFATKDVPTHISAISEADAARYAYFFGVERVSLMPNIKFDRAAAAPPPDKVAALKSILPSPEDSPTLLLASVRAEEEEQLAELIKKLRDAIPGLLILIVPKHLERIKNWLDMLAAQKIANPNGGPCSRLRSGLNQKEPARTGDIIVWDSIGELSTLYGFAKSAFVGGSLVPLGGQNFLEPLSQGIKPHMGPHWKNFAWVGRELIEQGLVKEVTGVQALEVSLLRDLKEPQNRLAIKHAFSQWLVQHQGGTRQAAALIRNKLGQSLEY